MWWLVLCGAMDKAHLANLITMQTKSLIKNSLLTFNSTSKLTDGFLPVSKSFLSDNLFLNITKKQRTIMNKLIHQTNE